MLSARDRYRRVVVVQNPKVRVAKGFLGIGMGFVFVMSFTAFGIDQSEVTSIEKLLSSSSSSIMSEDVNKIVDDIQKDINQGVDVTAKLDELMLRALATGNTSLQEYVTLTKQRIELEKQLTSVKGNLKALTAGNSSLSQIDSKVQESLRTTVTPDTVKQVLQPIALSLFSDFSDADWGNLQNSMNDLGDFVKLDPKNPALSPENQSLMDIVLISDALDQNLIENKDLANAVVNDEVLNLIELEKQKYPSDVYNSLLDGSRSFQAYGKKSSCCEPNHVVMMGQSFGLSKPAITYNGHILVAIDDLCKYISASIQKAENNSTVAIQANNKLMEVERGSNVGYVNDKPVSMSVPVLYFKDTIYISAEFFAEGFDISCTAVTDMNAVILYGDAAK